MGSFSSYVIFAAALYSSMPQFLLSKLIKLLNIYILSHIS